MSKQYLTQRQLEVVMNLKSLGAKFFFEPINEEKYMLNAQLRNGETRSLLAVLADELYPFKETLDII